MTKEKLSEVERRRNTFVRAHNSAMRDFKYSNPYGNHNPRLLRDYEDGFFTGEACKRYVDEMGGDVKVPFMIILAALQGGPHHLWTWGELSNVTRIPKDEIMRAFDWLTEQGCNLGDGASYYASHAWLCVQDIETDEGGVFQIVPGPVLMQCIKHGLIAEIAEINEEAKGESW